MKLVICSGCERHISTEDAACPFCARDGRGTSSRWMAAWVGASLIGVACTGAPASSPDSGGAAPTPHVVPAPAYGMPPPPTPESTPTPDTVTPPIAPLYGMPPPTTPDAGVAQRRERPAVPAYGLPPPTTRPERPK